MTNLNELFTHETDLGGVVKLEYDENNKLYVNGEKLLTTEVIKLRWLELTLAIISSFAICRAESLATCQL